MILDAVFCQKLNGFAVLLLGWLPGRLMMNLETLIIALCARKGAFLRRYHGVYD